MENGMNFFKSEGLKFIYVRNPFKINDLQVYDKLSLDIATYNFNLIVGFNRWV